MPKIKPTSFDRIMRGLFSSPETMPSWARKVWGNRAELEANGRRVAVDSHEDNTGAPCRNVGPHTLVHDLRHHDCCYICNDASAALDGPQQ